MGSWHGCGGEGKNMVEAHSGNVQKIVVVSLAWMPIGIHLPGFKDDVGPEMDTSHMGSALRCSHQQ